MSARRRVSGREQTPAPLRNEIEMVRRILGLVMDRADECANLNGLLKLLDTVSMAGTRLATLLKTERGFNDTGDDKNSAALGQVLTEVLAEMEKAGEDPDEFLH